MIHVHKRSAGPAKPWDVVRLAGANNVAPQHKHKYLILWNVECVRRNGEWHYVLDFDGRDSLEKSELALLMGDASDAQAYADKVDWNAWLGKDWEVINESKRWTILHPEPAGPRRPTRDTVKISTFRIGARSFPLPEVA
ncbi:MAG TPA: hypothetical protein VK324_01025 [Tepidisphaeraceae bacterium]|nr:hypothetical protein [Tepidisphaeraceae bacterium]